MLFRFHEPACCHVGAFAQIGRKNKHSRSIATTLQHSSSSECQSTFLTYLTSSYLSSAFPLSPFPFSSSPSVNQPQPQAPPYSPKRLPSLTSQHPVPSVPDSNRKAYRYHISPYSLKPQKRTRSFTHLISSHLISSHCSYSNGIWGSGLWRSGQLPDRDGLVAPTVPLTPFTSFPPFFSRLGKWGDVNRPEGKPQKEYQRCEGYDSQRTIRGKGRGGKGMIYVTSGKLATKQTIKDKSDKRHRT